MANVADLMILALAGFTTSLMTAVVGLGGGVVLMLLMPGLMPLAAIIPIHAVVQFISNFARVGFAFRHADLTLLLPLTLGSLLGAAIGSPAVDLVSFAVLPGVAGVMILLVVWLPLDRFLPQGGAALFALGLYQTGLGMVAGATGPLGAVVLNRITTEREWLVVNTGVYMTINHGIRTVAFGLLGFAFNAWWLTITVMSLAVIIGSWLGTRLRQSVPQTNFEAVFKWIVTVLALRMVILTVLEMKA